MMDKREADFLVKLLETFKVESEDHLKSISDHLLLLEKNPAKEKQQEFIDSIFRDAHSLKGAARSVNLDAIQTICQSLEDVLALWKENKISPVPSFFDTLYATVDFISKFISVPNSPLNKEQLNSLTDKLEALKACPEVSNPEVSKKKKRQSLPQTKLDKKPLLEPLESDRPIVSNKKKLKNLVKNQGISPIKNEKPVPLTSTFSEKPPAEKPPNTGNTPQQKGKTIRIAVDKLDKLFQHVEEMLVIKLTFGQCISDIKNLKLILKFWDKEWLHIQPELLSQRMQLRHAPVHQTTQNEEKKSQLNKILDFLDWQASFVKSFSATLNKLTKNTAQDNRIVNSMVDGLLDETKKILMQPFSTLLEAFPRMVRDISQSLGKEVKLVIEGDSIEIDRRILEEMKDPLIHMIRNSIDHGIELPDERLKVNKPSFGTLKIIASQFSGSSIQIIISDDGRGIDVENVKSSALKHGLINPMEIAQMTEQEVLMLIFQSGLSTSPIITELSGRGLGLGIVSEKIEKLGGQIRLETINHTGTTFRIILPSTLATFRGIHIRSADQDFIIPTNCVKRVVRIKVDAIKTIENRETIIIDNRTLSLVSLSDVLGINQTLKKKLEDPFLLIAIIKAAEVTVAFSIDQVLNEHEVFVKGLGKQLKRLQNISAATIMEWGKVIPILDPFDLIKSATRKSHYKQIDQSFETETTQKSILIVEDSVTARMLLKNILESAGYLVKTAVDGAEGYSFLKTDTFDLILSDVEMPRMDGFELTSKIRSSENYKDLPIVLCTSRGSKEDRERGIEVGANAYIDKSSFAQSNLLDIIKKLL